MAKLWSLRKGRGGPASPLPGLHDKSLMHKVPRGSAPEASAQLLCSAVLHWPEPRPHCPSCSGDIWTSCFSHPILQVGTTLPGAWLLPPTLPLPFTASTAPTGCPGSGAEPRPALAPATLAQPPGRGRSTFPAAAVGPTPALLLTVGPLGSVALPPVSLPRLPNVDEGPGLPGCPEAQAGNSQPAGDAVAPPFHAEQWLGVSASDPSPGWRKARRPLRGRLTAGRSHQGRPQASRLSPVCWEARALRSTCLPPASWGVRSCRLSFPDLVQIPCLGCAPRSHLSPCYTQATQSLP